MFNFEVFMAKHVPFLLVRLGVFYLQHKGKLTTHTVNTGF